MKKQDVLLASIDSKLNLLLVMVSEYQTKIPTIVARIRQAKTHLKVEELEALFFDLEWITTTILSKKALRSRFEYQTLDLYKLKEELKKYLQATKQTNPLTKAVQQYLPKLIRAFESIEQDFIHLEKQTRNYYPEIYQPLKEIIQVATVLKNKLWVPSRTTEQEILEIISNLTKEIKYFNKILLQFSHVELLYGMQLVLLHDWKKLIQILADIITNIHVETKSPVRIQWAQSSEGVAEIQVR